MRSSKPTSLRSPSISRNTVCGASCAAADGVAVSVSIASSPAANRPANVPILVCCPTSTSPISLGPCPDPALLVVSVAVPCLRLAPGRGGQPATRCRRAGCGTALWRPELQKRRAGRFPAAAGGTRQDRDAAWRHAAMITGQAAGQQRHQLLEAGIVAHHQHIVV